jgi:hypothetical protein
MACFTCHSSTPSTVFKALSRAAAKAASAKLRRIGALPLKQNWTSRAIVCERCPMRVVRNGTSYCGRPYLQQVVRDPVVDGCGCPTREKAKSPHEHCPLTVQGMTAEKVGATCNCKWCTMG